MGERESRWWRRELVQDGRERVRLGDGSVREIRGWERERVRVRDGMGERESREGERELERERSSRW